MDSPHLRKYGFRNPKNFWSWNPQSGKIWIMESGILGFGIRNTARGIQNHANDWNAEYRIQVPLTKIWNPGTGIGNPGRGIRNPDSLTWGQWIEVNLKYVDFQNYAILKMKVRWLVSSFFFFFVVVIIIIRGSSSSNNNMHILFFSNWTLVHSCWQLKNTGHVRWHKLRLHCSPLSN